MKFLQHSEIDLKKWDKAILDSEMPLVFAQSFYLNATSPGWSALITDNYKSVMPVTANKKLGINYVIQPPFTPQLGIFGNYNNDIANEFFDVLKEKFKYISIELNATNNYHGKETTKDKRTFVIDYDQPYSYNSNTKRNIAKANKLNLKLEEISPNEILHLTKKHLHPFLKDKLKIESKQVKQFDQLLLNSLENKYLRTFIVKDPLEKVLAIAHYISNGKHAVYLKGTSFDKSSNSGSMHFLMDHAIGVFKEEKNNMFDFGGGQSDSIAQFFMGFGAKPINYKIYKVNNLPKAIKWLKR